MEEKLVHKYVTILIFYSWKSNELMEEGFQIKILKMILELEIFITLKCFMGV